MQFSVLFLSALAGFAAAQDLSSLLAQYPQCSLACLTQGAAASNCQPTDAKCQCANSATIAAAATPCLAQACSAADLQTVSDVSTKICAAVAAAGSSTAASGATTSAAATMGASTMMTTSTPSATMGAGGNMTMTTTSSATTSTMSPVKAAGARFEMTSLGLAGVAGLIGAAML